jgi:hypothetical protein
VESEIQNSLTDYEVSDEEYVAICRAAWSRQVIHKYLNIFIEFTVYQILFIELKNKFEFYI